MKPMDTTLRMRRHVLPDFWLPRLGGFGIPGRSWGFRLNTFGDTMSGFVSAEAAYLCIQWMRGFRFSEVPKLPNETFQPFQFGKRWNFFDPRGVMHGGFMTREEAMEFAQKLKDSGAYIIPS